VIDAHVNERLAAAGATATVGTFSDCVRALAYTASKEFIANAAASGSSPREASVAGRS
jgi:hypothetical protein